MDKTKRIGNKAVQLQRLEKLGFNVPTFFVFSEKTLERVGSNDSLYMTIENAFRGAGKKMPPRVSVRSSGSVSAAGRMKTLLDVSTDKVSLVNAFREVEESTKSPRLRKYLKMKGVEDFTYSIIVQEMVYGTQTDLSCSGVLITTNPYDTNDEYYAEIVFNSMGDVLMDGSKTPMLLHNLEDVNPIAKNKLDNLVWEIKKQFDCDQEVEFVLEGSMIYVLQTRDYKLSTKVLKNAKENLEYIGQGNSIIPCASVGKVTFDKHNTGADKILIIDTTDFEDTEAILNFAGVITRRGGRLSHAAIIANEFGLPCTVGARFEREPKEGDVVLFDENGTVFFVK